MNFCSLCYGSIESRAEDFHVCKRCGSVFGANGELIERRNAHIAPEVAAAIDAGALPLETIDGQVSALCGTCGTCGQRITKDTLTGTSCACAKGHVLYERDDVDAPDVIKDRNGDISLGLCKVCGKGEAELVEPCDAVSITFKRCTDDGSLVSPQGHRLAYGGVPGCWRVKPEDMPASKGSSYETT